MTQCNRCGEHNHDDARYCGTCGLSLPTSDGIGSLVADEPAPDDDTTPGLGPGASGGLRTSEYVSAPSFGETGPVADPAPTTPVSADSTTVVPPPGPPSGSHPGTHPDSSGTPRPVPVLAGRTSSSTGVMIAALAVAAVVIIGGVIVLLAAGSGDTGRTGDSTAPVNTSVEPVSSDPSVTAAPAELPVTAAPPPATELPTAPAPTVPPTPPATAAPAPAPTASPAPGSTTPPPLPTASRGPGDLGLTQPILDELCDGRYITFVGSAVGDRPYTAVVSELLDVYPGTNYIWTKSCPSLRQEFLDGEEIYGVVFGPYVTQAEACNARAFGPADAYVRRISTFDPQDHTIRC